MSESPEICFDGPEAAPRTLALAHGAGAGMDSPFMQAAADGLAARGVRVARFEFPYMAARRADGRKRPPNPEAKLTACWRSAIAALGGPQGLVVGGKSLGGRMASLVAAALEEEGTPVAGLVCLGYPFHPPGKPERLRIDHLRALRTPALIVQGSRDPFGTQPEVAGYPLSRSIRIHWAEDGDHDLRPRRASGRTADGNLSEALAQVAAFLASL